MQRRRGFTLIEMMVALAVLAGALAVLLGTQASSVRSLENANRMNMAAMLVHGQMLALEQQLLDDGFQMGIQTDHGDFRDQGFPEYEWLAEIEPIEITDDASDMFVGEIQAELFGEGPDGEGSLSGSAAVSQFLPMIIGYVPNLINQVGERTRRITLTIMWEGTAGPMHLTVSEYFVVMDRDQAYPNEAVQEIQLP